MIDLQFYKRMNIKAVVAQCFVILGLYSHAALSDELKPLTDTHNTCKSSAEFVHIFTGNRAIQSLIKAPPYGELGSIERQYGSLTPFTKILIDNHDEFKNPLFHLVFGFQQLGNKNFGTALAQFEIGVHYLDNSQICNKDLISMIFQIGRHHVIKGLDLGEEFMEFYTSRTTGLSSQKYKLNTTQYEKTICILSYLDKFEGQNTSTDIKECR